MGIKLDSVLLFSLVIPFIMSVSLWPGVTPYWLFGLIFLVLLLYIVLDVIKISQYRYHSAKKTLLWFLILVVIGSAFTSAMVMRHRTHPVYQIHDMALQQEIAMRFLLDGRNPYKETYFGTFLEQWHYSETEKNPALYHFVLLPFYILFAIPFYFVSNAFFGFFDGRIPLMFLFFITLFIAGKLPLEENKRRLFLTLLAFNPATLPFALEGRSDIFMYAFLFAGFYFLHKERYAEAGIPMGMAFAVKQSAWPILPFYFGFLYFKTRNLRKALENLLPFALIVAFIVMPFLFWNARAFFDSTVLYLSGGIPTSYPISGYGLGNLLAQIGLIKDIHTYYPFHIWQALVGTPLLVVLLRFLKKTPAVSRLILFYGIFLFVFWYLSRYFNNSHLGYLSMVFITAYFWPEEKNDE